MLPQDTAAICGVESITEEREIRISASTVVAFVEEVHILQIEVLIRKSPNMLSF